MRRMAFVLVFAAWAATTHPCCAVSRSVGSVGFRGQLNIIVWDRDTKTEHFIRNAKFESKEKDLAFIAPTPSVPDLGEANTRAFETLERIKRDSGAADRLLQMKSSRVSVEVMKEQKVAGYEAVVLRSGDAKALKSYLDRNGYTTSPDIDSWLQHYIDQDWVFTAFKVDSSAGTGETGLVRMSFKTDRPFNPYFVPESNRRGRGQLGVYVISDVLMETGKEYGRDHRLHMDWAAKIPNRDAESIGQDLGIKLPSQSVVAFFGDTTFPTYASEDVWFEVSTRDPRSLPSPVAPGTINPLWIGVAGGGIAGFLAWMLTQRKRS